MTPRRRKIILFAGLSSLMGFVACFFVYAYTRIDHNAIFTQDDIAKLPDSYAALVLGASKNTRGHPNQYFDGRVSAAAAIYAAGKCRKVIVSGDNGRVEYNEPEDMKQALMQHGVPEADIVCDYTGFRTLDSVIRLKAIFGQTSAIVVSQKFHNERAIYIAQANGIELTGFNAPDVAGSRSYKTRFREIFSRAMCVLDVQVFGTGPRFYGESIKI
jgi:SanA protein